MSHAALKCALCKLKDPNKKNTHYLTDGIIKSALNVDGGSARESGLIYELSNMKPTVEFSFGRNTPQGKIEEVLKRVPTEKEIELAGKIPFSVDFVFCKECEDKFSDIEKPFISKLLPRFRNANLDGIKILTLPDVKLIRQFFILQFWRTSICTDFIGLSDQLSERLRLGLLNINADGSEFMEIPLSITYLQTKGNTKSYTGNLVGFRNDKNPFIIHLNDFVLQMYEKEQDIRHIDYYGLNAPGSLGKFINLKETEFKFAIFNNATRLEFNKQIVINTTSPTLISMLKDTANWAFTHTFGFSALVWFSDEFVRRVINSNDERKFSMERIYDVLQSVLNDTAKRFWRS